MIKKEKKKKGPRIMIVDDNFFNIDILKDVMRQVLKIDEDVSNNLKSILYNLID